MDQLTIDNIESLFDRQPGWCVSLYLPTHRMGKEIREDPIRLKNRISDAEEQLEAVGLGGGDIKRLAEPARVLCDMDTEENREFWRHQGDGLAMFLTADGSEQYRLPESFEELTVVAHRFHVKPLLRAAQQDEQYCVLAVSENNVRFLEGSRNGLSARPIEDLPESLQAILGSAGSKGFGLHSFRIRANSGDTAVPHGHVESNEQHEHDRYFQLINDALSSALGNDKRPLVFAGVTELFPHFKSEVELKGIVETAVTGNPDESSDDELHEKAWPLVAEIFQAERAEVVDRFQSAEHTNLGDTSLKDIIVAAHDGRIETLLLKAKQHCWGSYDAEKRQVHLADESTAENYDLLDLAAVRTMKTDGRVVILEDDTRLGDAGIAAIYRYAVE